MGLCWHIPGAVAVWRNILRYVRTAALWIYLSWVRVFRRNYGRWIRGLETKNSGHDEGGASVAPLARLAIQHLANKIRTFPDEVRTNRAVRAFTLGLGIARYWLGLDWIEKHVNPEDPAPGFIRLELLDTDKSHIQTYRVADLGELLYNLQHVPGFDERVEEIRTADFPEPSIAELHVARILFVNDWEFRFIPRRGTRGADYDLEVDGTSGLICADVKCKIEATELSAKTIENTLRELRNQLPKDRPGVFFVKIPQHWTEQKDFAVTTGTAANAFFASGTGRVVSVIFYAEPLVFSGDTLFHGHVFKEVPNPRHRFGTDKDWTLLSRWRPPAGAPNALPDKWILLRKFSEDGSYDP